MAHHASAAGLPGDPRSEDQHPRASQRAANRGELPPHVRAARDELFVDADQHGPRWPDLVRRVLPITPVVPATIALAAWPAWRSLVEAACPARIADVVLVAPMLAGLVLLAAMLAPLARVRVEPLVGSGLVLLAVMTWLVRQGDIVAAAVPAMVGALLLGIAASRAVRRAVWLFPVLLAAGVSDAQSVQSGVTNRLLSDGAHEHASSVTAAATLSIPHDLIARVDLLVLHLPAASGTWLLGIVDVAAIGMLLGLTHLHWLPMARTAVAVGVALIVTVGMGVPVPVLPMLGVAWMLVHARLVWQSTRFSMRRLIYLGG
jgi:hypothetical protein